MKITLKRLNPKRDINHVMGWVNDPAVNFYFANMGKKSVAEERKFLNGIVRSRTDKVFSVFAGKEYVGQASINKIERVGDTGRLFLIVIPSQQGKGYARQIVENILEKSFLKFGLNKVWLITRAENKKRIQMWKHYGFKKEGVLEEEYKDSRGKRYDMVRLAILKKDWQM